jgi:hypothetical protein
MKAGKKQNNAFKLPYRTEWIFHSELVEQNRSIISEKTQI